MNDILQAALAVAGFVVAAIGIGHAKSKAQSVFVHHATHDDFMPDKMHNRIVGQWVGLLTLNSDLDTYRKGADGKSGHLGHHGRRFATVEYEESQFMLRAGYRPGMTRAQLWRHHVLLMLSPLWHLKQAVARVRGNLLGGPRWRRVGAWVFWGSALGVAGATGSLAPVALGWLAPLFVVGQMASWSEAVSRHRWLVSTNDPKRRHADLSQGRFLGAMPPPQGSSIRAWAGFWLRTAAALVGRALAVPADLPHHPYHHLGLDRVAVTGMVSWTDSAQEHSSQLWQMPQREYTAYASLFDATDAWFTSLSQEPVAPNEGLPLKTDDLEGRLGNLPR
jgi:hypothetical protein